MLTVLLLCLPPQSMEFAKAYALEHGPIIMEMDTYRWADATAGTG